MRYMSTSVEHLTDLRVRRDVLDRLTANGNPPLRDYYEYIHCTASPEVQRLLEEDMRVKLPVRSPVFAVGGQHTTGHGDRGLSDLAYS